MAVEKDKVLAKLNDKLKGRSVTKDYKNKLAERYAAKIETDDDIDAYVDDRLEDILEASAEADRRAKSAAEKAKEEAAKAVKGEQHKPEESTEDDFPDMPAYMKAFMKQQKENQDKLQAEIMGLKSERTQQTLAQRFKSDERFKHVPEKIMSKFIPQKEEDFETAAAELAEVWKDMPKGFGTDMPGRGGNNNNSGARNDEKPDDAVKAFAKAKNEQYLNSQKN